MSNLFYEFPAELALEEVTKLGNQYPRLRDKYFTAFIIERNSNRIFKVRSVNFSGLKSTAIWIRSEESRDRHYWNNFDSTLAPSKIDNNGHRPPHYKRGLTSWIPLGADVDLMIEVQPSKEAANQTKDAFVKFEANQVRRPPDATPELKKAQEGKPFDEEALYEELKSKQEYKHLYLTTSTQDKIEIRG